MKTFAQFSTATFLGVKVLKRKYEWRIFSQTDNFSCLPKSNSGPLSFERLSENGPVLLSHLDSNLPFSQPLDLLFFSEIKAKWIQKCILFVTRLVKKNKYRDREVWQIEILSLKEQGWWWYISGRVRAAIVTSLEIQVRAALPCWYHKRYFSPVFYHIAVPVSISWYD